MSRAKLVWLTAVVGLLTYEFYALNTGGETLSAAMADLDRAWPFFGELVAFVVGGLMVHFFWIWSPSKTSTSHEHESR